VIKDSSVVIKDSSVGISTVVIFYDPAPTELVTDNISVGPALFRSHPQKGFAFLKLTRPSKAGPGKF